MKHLIRSCAVLLLAGPVLASASVCPFAWERNLRIGSAGPDVLALQRFLNSDERTQIALTGPGSLGMESERFGPKTSAAVKRFQELYAAEVLTPFGLVHGTGVVGAKTRETMNARCAVAAPAAASSTSAVTVASLTVAASQQQPVASLAPSDAGYVPFTKFTLTAAGGDVTVTKFVVMRAGAGNNAAFYSIGLEEVDGDLFDKERGLDSNSKVTFSGELVIPAGETKEFLIYGNMNGELADYAGQTPMLFLTDIVSNAPVSGSLPVRGSYQTVNDTIKIGSGGLLLSSYDPGTNMTRYPFDKQVRFAGIRITASSKEDLLFDEITFRQGGTISPRDIENLTLVVDGFRYPMEISGQEYSVAIEPGVVIQKGRAIDVHVEGDILPSAGNRTIKFDIHAPDDISLKGLTYGFYVAAWPESNTAMSGNSVFLTSDGTTDGDEVHPFFSGALVTVVPASMQVGR